VFDRPTSGENLRKTRAGTGRALTYGARTAYGSVGEEEMIVFLEAEGDRAQPHERIGSEVTK
jgi:hypothetical protein